MGGLHLHLHVEWCRCARECVGVCPSGHLLGPQAAAPGGTELLGPTQLPARLAEGRALSPGGGAIHIPSSGAEGSSPETSEVSPSLWGVQPEPGRN